MGGMTVQVALSQDHLEVDMSTSKGKVVVGINSNRMDVVLLAIVCLSVVPSVVKGET